jgi:hypothetical protein
MIVNLTPKHRFFDHSCSGRRSGEGFSIVTQKAFMRKGVWLRLGVSVREFGERMAHRKHFGIRIFWLPSWLVIRTGNSINALAMQFYSVGNLI